MGGNRQATGHAGPFIKMLLRTTRVFFVSKHQTRIPEMPPIRFETMIFFSLMALVVHFGTW